MRDFVLLAHVILGFALVVLPIIIILELNRKRSSLIKPLALITAAIAWILNVVGGKLYITFYPATKTLIKAGSWPWAHSIIMETKEHWVLLIPVIATVAAGLVFTKKAKESKRWWILVLILSLLAGITGRIIKIGALA